MRPEGDTSFLDRTSAEERSALERMWADGKLVHHHHQLLNFISEQCVEILRLAEGNRETAALVAATQKLVATLRIVHHQSEMQAQMREIHNEIWYCGQRGEFDTKLIAREWVARHGLNWRRWRIKEFQFVTEHCSAEIGVAVNNT
jgi:hypothetical protein